MNRSKFNSKFQILSSVLLISLLIVLPNSISASVRLLHEKSFDVNPGEMLEVKADVGDVEIKAWDKNEVYVKIYGNRRAEDKMDFEIERTSGGVRVTAEKEGSSWFNWFGSISVKIEIKVPVDFNLDTKTSGGDINADDVNGEASLKTSGGDVKVKNCKGRFTMKTSGGDVNVYNHIGNTAAGTSGGDIEFVKCKGDINAGTSGGNIKLEVSDAKIEASTSGGDIRVNYSGDCMGIKLTTSGGDIDLRLVDNVSADLELYTSGGDIDVNLMNVKVDKVSRGKYIGRVNHGGEKIYCKTSGGDITVN